MDHNAIQQTERTPDNIITLDISSVKTLQIGYQAETIFLRKAQDSMLTVKEYIGQTAYEYLGKVNANRFKTTIRYGRREGVDTNTFVEVFLPEDWSGELLLYSQYGHISTEDSWNIDRFAAETSEGLITIRSITAPRIRLVSSSNSVKLDEARGFADIHTTTGNILVSDLSGGAKLETSSGNIQATFSNLNNVVECATLQGNIELALPESTGIIVDGITKRGEIFTDREGLEIKLKPGNVKNIIGTLGEKPFQKVKLSTINGSFAIH